MEICQWECSFKCSKFPVNVAVEFIHGGDGRVFIRSWPSWEVGLHGWCTARSAVATIGSMRSSDR